MTTATDYPTCEQRVDAALADRIADIRKLLDLYYEDSEADDDDLGNIHDYGLSLEWSQPDEDTGEQYLRYILSTGGPHDEFRIWPNAVQWSGMERVQYVYQDWFDGATSGLTGSQWDTMAEWYDLFADAMPEPEVWS